MKEIPSNSLPLRSILPNFTTMPTDRSYIAIDLKSFYASVECVERGLDPLTTNLVVADVSRTSKTICLAISPSLKAYGLGGRARLFEVEQRMREVNNQRRHQLPVYDDLCRYTVLLAAHFLVEQRMGACIDETTFFPSNCRRRL